MVEFQIATKQPSTSWKTKYRDYRKADYEKVREEIQREEYIQQNDNSDTESMWNRLKSKLKDVVENSIPLKERQDRKP